LIAFDVSADVEAPKSGDRPIVMRSLDEDEARALVTAAKLDESLGALWLLGLTTGARRGEMLALTWSAIDLTAGTVKIERGVQRTTARGGWRIGPLKTAASRRELSLTPEVVEALRAHQRRQKAFGLKVGLRWNPSAFVFQCPDGAFLTPDRAACAHRAFIAAHNLPVHRFHDLRHTCATLLLKHGEAVHVVARQLGHASPSMTLNRYSHALPDQRKGVASRMSALLAG
jgi:integrase